jgi:hypothetical protein
MEGEKSCIGVGDNDTSTRDDGHIQRSSLNWDEFEGHTGFSSDSCNVLKRLGYEPKAL